MVGLLFKRYRVSVVKRLIIFSVMLLTFSIYAAEKPNVMFIFADDLTHEGIAAYGLTEVKTPNLDRLVNRGVSFRQCYNMGAWNGAVCMASRAMLNTGCFVNRAQEGVDKYPHWSELMQGAGYTTYMTGKWHVKGQPRFDVVKDVRPGMPNQTEQGYNRPKNEDDYKNGWKPWETKYDGFWKGGTHWTQVVADNSLEFLEQAKKDDKPFFMYLAFNAPHDPRQSPKEYVDMYPLDSIKVPVNFLPEYPYAEAICGKNLRDERLMPYPRTDYAVKVNRQEYYAAITYMDFHIGRILDALEATGKAENTVIIFTADHGLAVGHHGLVGKQNMYQDSMCPPFIIAGPGIKGNRSIDAPIYLQDAMATALELAGVKKPEHVEFNSVLPLVRGDKDVQYERIYGKYIQSQRMIRKGDWKLIFYPFAEKKMRLFNLKKDPWEMNDLIDNPEYSELVKGLRKEFFELQKEMGDELDVDNPKLPVQQPQQKSNAVKQLTELDASIATSHPAKGGDNAKHNVKTMIDGNPKTKYYRPDITLPVSFTLSLNKGAQFAKSYSLMSGNDMPVRDPKSWNFYGSNDGQNWTLLDKRNDEKFFNRYQLKTYKIAEPQSFSKYKLEVTATASNQGVQIAEIRIGDK